MVYKSKWDGKPNFINSDRYIIPYTFLHSEYFIKNFKQMLYITNLHWLKVKKYKILPNQFFNWLKHDHNANISQSFSVYSTTLHRAITSHLWIYYATLCSKASNHYKIQSTTSEYIYWKICCFMRFHFIKLSTHKNDIWGKNFCFWRNCEYFIFSYSLFLLFISLSGDNLPFFPLDFKWEKLKITDI